MEGVVGRLAQVNHAGLVVGAAARPPPTILDAVQDHYRIRVAVKLIWYRSGPSPISPSPLMGHM